jgi:hypothetical protein
LGFSNLPAMVVFGNCGISGWRYFEIWILGFVIWVFVICYCDFQICRQWWYSGMAVFRDGVILRFGFWNLLFGF